jgi:hypothetical protein
MKDKKVQEGLDKLNDRGWLAIYYASAAYIALVQNDTVAAGFYNKQLRMIEESRSQAIAIAMLNTLMDEIFADVDKTGEPNTTGSHASSDPRQLGKHDTEAAVVDGVVRRSSTSYLSRWWRAFRQKRSSRARNMLAGDQE